MNVLNQNFIDNDLSKFDILTQGVLNKGLAYNTDSIAPQFDYGKNGKHIRKDAKKLLLEKGYNFINLLRSEESQPKIRKNGKIIDLDILSFYLPLKAKKSGGYGDLCNRASPFCILLCIQNTGDVSKMDNKEKSRMQKVKCLFVDTYLFNEVLKQDITMVIVKALKIGKLPVIRFNMISDYPFHLHYLNNGLTVIEFFKMELKKYLKLYKVKLSPYQKKHYIPNYDYTADSEYLTQIDSKIQHLTFSRKENNSTEWKRVLTNGLANVAIALDITEKDSIPTHMLVNGKYYACVNGDAYDYRVIDGKYKIVILRYKIPTSRNGKKLTESEKIIDRKKGINSGFVLPKDDKRFRYA